MIIVILGREKNTVKHNVHHHAHRCADCLCWLFKMTKHNNRLIMNNFCTRINTYRRWHSTEDSLVGHAPFLCPPHDSRQRNPTIYPSMFQWYHSGSTCDLGWIVFWPLYSKTLLILSQLISQPQSAPEGPSSSSVPLCRVLVGQVADHANHTCV